VAFSPSNTPIASRSGEFAIASTARKDGSSARIDAVSCARTTCSSISSP
jgi:hypothetical protein